MHNATQTECTIAKVASILSDTWTMRIMHALMQKPMRFCELERLLDGISTRTLTLKLTKLTSEHMVTKNAVGVYAMSARGKELRGVINAMVKYQKKYL